MVDRKLTKWAWVRPSAAFASKRRSSSKKYRLERVRSGLVGCLLAAACSRTDIDWSKAAGPGSGTGAVGAVAGSGAVGAFGGFGAMGGGGTGGRYVGGAGGRYVGGTGGRYVGGTGGGYVGGGGTGGSVHPSGGNPGGRCQADSECADADPCTTDRCGAGRCVYTVRDDDADGYVSRACGGLDCNDRNASAHPGAPELCSDGADNDCNGVADCFDPKCADDPDCGCVPRATGEDCLNGVDDDCDGAVDCLDPDCIGTPDCGCTQHERDLCDNGIDDDCDGKIDCDDSDCSKTDLCSCQATREQCRNGKDDDCDLLVDCADPDCAGLAPCDCRPPGVPENCSNGRDDDCDGQVDCADSDCVLSVQCQHCVAEVCDNGVDDDCDGAIDCADSGCYLDPACPVSTERCGNRLDDDFDGLTDCSDPDCADNPSCVEEHGGCLTAALIESSGRWTGSTVGHVGENHGTCGGEAGEAVFELRLSVPSRVHLDTIGSDFDNNLYVRAGSCESGRELGCDDDSAGTSDPTSWWDALLEFGILQPGSYFVFVDGLMVDPDSGPNEGNYVLNVEIVPNPSEDCFDRADNDGDQLADCADPDCLSTSHCARCNGGLDPEPELGPARCTDGLDNDCDGATDCADPDCSASDVFKTECCDGNDENGNGIPDDFNCRCISDADCPWDQLCYTHGVGACGPPCQLFVGDVCPIEAPGSVCNPATSQCEF
jgi:hypothetical protein